MTTPVGGDRHRLIVDSLFNMVKNCLDQLSWTTQTSWHQAVRMLPDAVDDEDEVVFNTVAMSDEDIVPTPIELGSSMTQDSWSVWFDCFCENAIVGKALAHDIRDILAGLHPDVGRSQGGLLVMDYRLATPMPIFSVDIEKVDLLRAKDFPKDWQRFYWVVRCEILDEYGPS